MGKILVIDDDIRILGIVEAFLQSTGHDVHCKNTSVDINDLCHKEKFDLIICDIFMPEINGYNLILEIRNDFPDLPVIMMSGGMNNSHIDLLNFTDSLADVKRIEKPFSIDQLNDMVHSCIKSCDIPEQLNDEMSKFWHFSDGTFNPESIQDFSEEFDKNKIENLVLKLEIVLESDDSSKESLISETFREVHSLKGTACFCALEPIIFYLN